MAHVQTPPNLTLHSFVRVRLSPVLHKVLLRVFRPLQYSLTVIRRQSPSNFESASTLGTPHIPSVRPSSQGFHGLVRRLPLCHNVLLWCIPGCGLVVGSRNRIPSKTSRNVCWTCKINKRSSGKLEMIRGVFHPSRQAFKGCPTRELSPASATTLISWSGREEWRFGYMGSIAPSPIEK